MPVEPVIEKSALPIINKGFDSGSLIAPLTSLRFFAAFYVLIFHSGSTSLIATGKVPEFGINFLRNGSLAVSFFFILSGFILQHVYRGRINTRNQVRNYFGARIARIYPLYLMLLLVSFFLPYNKFSGSSLPQFLLLELWVPERLKALDNWNMPAWTLSAEIAFYLAFPLIARLLRVASFRQVVSMTIFVAAIVPCLGTPNVTTGHYTFPWMDLIPVPILRLPEFILGVCLFELHIRRPVQPPRRSRVWQQYASIATTLVLLTAPRVPIDFGLVALSFAWLIVALVRAPDSWLFKALSDRRLVLLGGASFSLYLSQTVIHGGFTAFLPTSFIVVYVPVMIISSLLLFRFVEQPARKIVRRLACAA